MQIKGAAFLGTIKFVKAKGFPGGLEALLADLPAPVRSVFDERIQSLRWYPYEAYAGLLEGVDRKMGRGDLALMPELGRYGAEEDVRGLLKAMVTLFSPERGLTQAGYFWSKHCDAGVFAATDIAPGRATAELRDFPDVSPAHCHLLVGWLDGIGIALGARDGGVEKSACVHRGDPVCRYRMSWS